MESALVWDGIEVAALYVSEGRQVRRTGRGVTHLVSPPLSQTVLSSVLWSVGIVRDDISAQSSVIAFVSFPVFILAPLSWLGHYVDQSSHSRLAPEMWSELTSPFGQAKNVKAKVKGKERWRVALTAHPTTVNCIWTDIILTCLLSKTPPIRRLRNCDAAFKTENVNKSKWKGQNVTVCF